MSPSTPLLFLAFLFFLLTRPAAPQATQDRQALLALYQALGGSSWTLKWETSKNICTNSLGTVSCDLSGKVRQLRLQNNLLTGTLPTEIGLLTSLTNLQMQGNSISGSIPTQLGALTSLNTLALTNNQLSGAIPTEIALLNRLSQLSLANNQLTGTIPTEVAQATNLIRLFLNNNQLSGQLPSTWNSNLTQLYLFSNQLTGTIPPGIFQSKLTQFRVNQNSLTGTIPTQVGTSTSLTEFFVFQNSLTGSLPTELGNIPTLLRVWGYLNQLSGSLPTQLGQITNLLELRFHGNSLTGSIPSQLGSLTALKMIRLGNNQLSGTIPTQLGSVASLTSLGLSGNLIVGDIPGGLLRNANLVTLFLNNTCLGPVEPYSNIPQNDYSTFTVKSTCSLSGPYPSQTLATTSIFKYEFYSAAPLSDSSTSNVALTVGNSNYARTIVSFGQNQNPFNSAVNISYFNATTFALVSASRLTFAGSFSIEVLFQFGDLSTIDDVVAIGSSPQLAQTLRAKINSNGSLQIFRASTVQVYLSAANLVAPNRVHHLVVAWDSTSKLVTTFLNGAQLSQVNLGTQSLSGQLSLALGRRSAVVIDEAYVYPTALTQSLVTSRLSTLNWCPTGACTNTCTPTNQGSLCT